MDFVTKNMTQKLIAVYGTLKRRHYNNYLLGDDAVFLGTHSVSGWMHLCGTFPRLYSARQDPTSPEIPQEYALEVYEIDNENIEAINCMELAAGYTQEHIETPYGVATIYYSEPQSHRAGHPFISVFE